MTAMSETGDHIDTVGETLVSVEEPDDARIIAGVELRIPGADEAVDGAGEKEVDVFCTTGLQSGSPADTGPVLPAILFPYLTGHSLRRPWPLIVRHARSGVRVETLVSVIDTLANAVEEEGDQGELQKRAFYRLEHDIVEACLQETVSPVDVLLGKLEAEIENTRADRRAFHARAVREFGEYTGERSLLIGYGEEGLGALMTIVAAQVSAGRQRTFNEETEWLATRLEDILRVDEEDSHEGHSPEKLERSVGGEYTRAIDFSSLSHLLDEAPHGAALEPTRKQRIEKTHRDLLDLSSNLFDDGGTGIVHTAEDALSQLTTRVGAFTDLVRARQIARLEIENRYRSEIHDALFESFDYDAVPANEKKAFPPVLVHLHLESAGDASGVDRLLRALNKAGVARILVTYQEVFDEWAAPALGLDIAASMLAKGNVFVQQSTAALADFIASGVQLCVRSQGSTVLSVCTGSESDVEGIDAFMSAALAADSRAVPAFRHDPEQGEAWADRFSASENEQPASTWAVEAIDVRTGEALESRPFATTPADVLAIEPHFARYFLPVASSLESPRLLELTEYFELEESARGGMWPYVWMSDRKGVLLRMVLAPAAVRAVESLRMRWKTIQEWAGIDSSILERGLMEANEAARLRQEEAVAAAESDFEARMNESIETLAQKIVGNIAASMLGMEAGVIAPSMAAPVSARKAEPREEAPSEEAATPEPPLNEAEDEEDEPAISLDEAYIDTPLCTSCNECTDLNGLIFGYNENKQAYIKDAAAGPYRDLVLAAEKCPVGIIHPGKPLDASEKDLDEWIERAKPFM